MILSDRSNGHKAHIISQFESVLPGFNSYRVKFGRGPGYAVTVFVDMRIYFSHDGLTYHYSRNSRAGAPAHMVEIEAYKP